jgi:hypothetical protein
MVYVGKKQGISYETSPTSILCLSMGNGHPKSYGNFFMGIEMMNISMV